MLTVGLVLAACERRSSPAPAEPAPPPAPAVAPAAPAPAPELRLEQLRVVLGTEASLAPAVARRPWVGPIVEVLAQDDPEAPALLDRSRVEGASIALDRLFARGLDNLRKASPQPLRERTVAAAKARLQITQFADNYTAARLLLPELWSKVAAENGGRLYAAAPVRDMLIWTTSAAKDDQLALRAHVRAAYRSRSYPISPAILRWTARGWTLVDENPTEL